MNLREVPLKFSKKKIEGINWHKYKGWKGQRKGVLGTWRRLEEKARF